MEQIRKLIWNGAINTQILIDESLLVGESSEGSNKLNVRVLRDVLYSTLLVPYIRRFEDTLERCT